MKMCAQDPRERVDIAYVVNYLNQFVRDSEQVASCASSGANEASEQICEPLLRCSGID